MDLEFTIIKVEIDMKENLRMTMEKEKEYSIMLMVIDMKDNFIKEGLLEHM